MTKLEKLYSIIENSREGGSEAKQGCSSANRGIGDYRSRPHLVA